MQKNNTPMLTEEKKGWKAILFVFIAQITLGMSLAIFTPENILTYPWAKAWTEFVLGHTFPKLLDVPHLSPIPQVVVFYHAAMVFFLLFFTFLLICILANLFLKKLIPVDQEVLQAIRSRARMLGAFFFSFLFILLIFNAFFQYGYGVDENSFSTSKYSALMFGSRVSLCVGAVIFPWTYLLLMIYGFFFIPILFFQMYSRLPWFSKKEKIK